MNNQFIIKDGFYSSKNQNNDIEKYGFYIDKNEYVFPEKIKNDYKEIHKSNFILMNEYLLQSKTKPQRIIKIINTEKYEIEFDISSKELASVYGFKGIIEGKGNFVFEGNQRDLDKIKRMIFKNAKNAKEIQQLGFNNEFNIYSFSNGIYLIDNDKFLKINDLGIVKTDKRNYYIPALSSINIDSNEFENYKKFIFIKGPVNFNKWSKLFCSVYKPNGEISICYLIASLFRDIIYKELSCFPHLFYFGPPETGKSMCYESILSFFGKRQKPIGLENGSTAVASFRKLDQFKNAIIVLNEYKNSIDKKLIGMIKSAYDGDGRETGNYSNDNKTNTTKIGSGIIIAGQELPTQETAMFTRMILQSFYKTEWSNDEKTQYNNLKTIESNGLTQIIIEIIKHRAYFQNNFSELFKSTSKELKKIFKYKKISDRSINNVSILLSVYNILNKKLDFPFNYNDLLKKVTELIEIQINILDENTEVTIFWEAIQYLFSNHKLTNEKDYIFKVENNKEIIYISISQIYPNYVDYCSKINKTSIAKDTLIRYLKKTLFFFIDKNIRIGFRTPWMYGFYYSDLKEKYDFKNNI